MGETSFEKFPPYPFQELEWKENKDSPLLLLLSLYIVTNICFSYLPRVEAIWQEMQES